jgi:hypothetical protein
MKNFKFTVLMSASVPTEERNAEFRKIANAQVQIEQAVIALARSVFQAGGRLVFGGHPSISPIVLMVAAEYGFDRPAESSGERQAKPVVIYQSKAYEEVIPDTTYELFNLGYAEINWTEAVEGEKFDKSVKDTEQCHRSLTLMRQSMVRENPDALVCIGGMEGVIEEFEIFRERFPNRLIYLFEPTGGASSKLAGRYGNSGNVEVIYRPEYKFIGAETPDPEPGRETREENRERQEIEIIPYTFLTAQVVRDILERRNSNLR